MNFASDINKNEVDILRVLIQESPDPIGLYVGREMRIRVANKAMHKTWGKDSTAVGKLYAEALPELAGQGIFELLEQVYTTGAPYEARQQRLDLMIEGQLKTHYFDFTFTPIKDTDGNVWGVLHTAKDLTELVLARNRAADARVSFTMEAAGIGNWDLDLINNEVWWDEKCKELFGFKKEQDVNYDDVLSQIHPLDRARVDLAVHEAWDPKLKKPYDIKYRTVGDNKVVRWVQCKGRAYFTENNEPIRFAGIAQDITEQVNADEKVKTAEQLTQLATEAAGSGTFFIDLLNNEAIYSPTFIKLLSGESKTDLSYEELVSYGHPDDLKIREKAIEEALLTGKLEYKMRVIWKDGSVHWVKTLGSYVIDPDGKPVVLMGASQDITEQVIAEQKARSAEQLTQLAAEAAGAGTFFIDLVNDEVVYSPTLIKIISGETDLGLKHIDLQQFVHPADSRKREKAFEKALVTGKLKYEVRFIWKDGSVHWIKTLGSYVFDPDGQPVVLMGTLQDITAEVEAHEEQQRLLWLIENSNDFISLSTRDGEVTYLNKAGLSMIGLERLKHARRPNVDYVMPHELERVQAEVNPTLLKDGRWSGEITYKNFTTGEAIPGYATTLLLRETGSGDPLGRATVFRDMRAEIASQTALAESEQIFRAITTASPTALWMADENGSITYVNQIWIDWTGNPLESHLGEGWLDAVLKDDIEQATNKFVHDYKDHRFHESQFRIKHHDGTLRWIVCTGNPQFNAKGQFTGYIGACVDISEQKQLQDQKDEFIGIASHELKTPVTSIKAYGQVLEMMFRKAGDDKKADMVVKMNNQVNRLSSLIGDLLDVTKIQSGRLQFNDTYFDFNQLVLDMVEDLQRTTTKHQILTELKPVGEVFADKDRISQVLTNLVTNAIKYSPDADKIIVKAEIENNEVVVCVEDFGIGIKEDAQNKVFEQFYRVSGDKQHTFPGLGLGLYISSEIIKREGGRIWVNSIQGKGSTFCFALPLKRAQS